MAKEIKVLKDKDTRSLLSLHKTNIA